jgi:putative transposase
MPPRSHSEALDKAPGPGRRSRVLSRWSPCGVLVLAQRAGRHRLRAVVHWMAAQAGALAPLSLTPPQRSTLAEAHNRRPAPRSHPLLLTRDTRGQAVAPGPGCRFNNPRGALDSTTSSRGVSLWPGARFRTATGAMPLHTLLDHAGHIPALGVIPAGQRHEIARARGRPRPKGSLVALDRGDRDARVRCRRTQDGVFFGTRQTVKATCRVTKRCEVDWQRALTSDHKGVWLGPQGHDLPHGAAAKRIPAPGHVHTRCMLDHYGPLGRGNHCRA